MGRAERIAEIESEIGSHHTAISKLSAEWSKLKGLSLDERMGELFGDSDITLETAMQVDLHECGNSSYGGTWWKMGTGFLEALTYDKGVLDGLYRTGANPDTGGQSLFSVKLNQNRPLEEQQGIKVILPLVKAFEGRKQLAIFEHTCSEYGSWLLCISEDDEVAEVWQHRYFRYKVEHGSTAAYHKADFIGSVDEALDYIYKTHPYELLMGSDSDEDDEW